MLETVCAELLITGLLAVNKEKIEVDQNNVHHLYSKNSTYIVPDKFSIADANCETKKINKDLTSEMSFFIKKIN